MKSILAGFVLLATAGAALASSSAERFSSMEASGFVVANEGANESQSIRESVPAGESVNQWTRMLTEMQFFGLARKTTPAKLTDMMIDGLKTSCPDATVVAVVNYEIDGFPATRMEADCPYFATTKRHEAFLSLVVSGPNDIHNRQVAFTYKPSPEESVWARGLLDTTHICRTNKLVPGC